MTPETKAALQRACYHIMLRRSVRNADDTLPEIWYCEDCDAPLRLSDAVAIEDASTEVGEK